MIRQILTIGQAGTYERKFSGQFTPKYSGPITPSIGTSIDFRHRNGVTCEADVTDVRFCDNTGDITIHLRGAGYTAAKIDVILAAGFTLIEAAERRLDQ